LYNTIKNLVSTLSPAAVVGFFGVGKTRAVVDVALSKPGPIVIISEPLRILRDSVATMYRALSGWDPPVLRAHDEVCQDLSADLAKDYSYYEALSIHLRSGSCIYIDHVRRVASSAYASGVLITTHRLSFIAKYVVEAISRSPAYLVVDEAEDFVLKALEPVPPEEVEPYRHDPIIWRRISRIFEKVGGKYYVKAGHALAAMRYMLLSATLPPSLKTILSEVGGYDDYTYTTTPEREDIFIIYSGVIPWLEMRRGLKKIASIILGVCTPPTQAGGICAVVSKNKEATDALASELRRFGMPVISDQDPAVRGIPQGYSGVVIITVGGRFYRGVSLPEADVVVSMFQRFYRDPEHPALTPLSADGLDTAYSYELAQASNLQASYRCNRSGGKRHVMVFLDGRYYDSFSTYYETDLKMGRISSDLRIVREGELASIPKLVERLL
jgi:hypothetical protein